MKVFKTTKNRPVKALINEFSNKNSGKVSLARYEIKHRFDYLDWKDQKKIIPLFLNSCASDRKWIYPKLLNLWDESFANDIVSNWEKHHEERCSWIVVRYLPLSYLKNHLEDLSQGRNYYFLCKRFAQDKDFVVDKNKFIFPCDYLSILVERTETISDEEAKEILLTLLQEGWNDVVPRNIIIPRGYVSMSSHYGIIRYAKNLLLELGKGHTVNEFDKWDESIRLEILNSKKYEELINSAISDYDYQTEIIKLTTSIQKERFNELFQTNNPCNEQMFENLKEQNPNFKLLVETLDLELEKTN